MKLTEERTAYRRRQRGKALQALLMLFVIGLCGYMIRDQWDDLSYDLSEQSLVDLGRAEGSDPGTTVGDRDLFVRISGITSSRGAMIKAGRLGSLLRSDRWYRQLVGAPVFLEIEVGQDEAMKQRYPVFAEVDAEGRGRLLRSSSDYDGIVSFFQQHYGYEMPENALVISVDRRPGGSYGSLVTSGLLGLVALLNLTLLVFVLLRKPRVEADNSLA